MIQYDSAYYNKEDQAETLCLSDDVQKEKMAGCSKHPHKVAFVQMKKH